MAEKITITVEVEDPLSSDFDMTIRVTRPGEPEPMLVANQKERLADPQLTEAVATLLRNATKLVEGTAGGAPATPAELDEELPN